MTYAYKPDGSPSKVDEIVLELIPLIESLIEVVHAENQQLAKGIPASLSSAIGQKVTLAQKVERLNDLSRMQGLTIEHSDAALYAKLLTSSKLLAREMDENAARLKAAMEATRRRTEAALRAIRQKGEQEVTYGRNARMDTRVVQATSRNGCWI